MAEIDCLNFENKNGDPFPLRMIEGDPRDNGLWPADIEASRRLHEVLDEQSQRSGGV
jgi:hypothetical protein